MPDLLFGNPDDRQRASPSLPAIRAVLAAYRSTDVHINEEQITAAWAEYEAVRAALGTQVKPETDKETVMTAMRRFALDLLIGRRARVAMFRDLTGVHGTDVEGTRSYFRKLGLR